MTVVEHDDGTVAATPDRSLSPSSVFAGRYLIEKKIGEGGMGSVYAAVDRELGERVALKVLSSVGEILPPTLERFRREVRVARRVTHRNAARTFDIGEHEGLHFLTMELVEGESLAGRLRRDGRLAPEVVVEIGRQICEGLAAVHDAGLVHRDLKPSNVLLETGGRVVLTDFGIARPVQSDQGLTQDKDVVGTPRYMAPEQIGGQPITAQADVYALGLVLYEMVSGRLPFEAETAIASAVARLQRAAEPPERYASVSPELSAVILSCLSREPKQRPATAGAVRTLLSRLVTQPATDDTLIASPGTLTRSSTSTSFASVDVGECCLAVLPLRYRGPPDDEYLAEALTEELVDLLSMTRGLRVPAAGACEPFAQRRDPRAVREALGCDVVVDGTMQKSGSQLRVVVRLLDAVTGYQTWRERFDGPLEDVFQLQDHIASRVAETLRLQLESSRYQFSASEEAVALYMQAKVQQRRFHRGGRGSGGAVDLLRRCLALAPDFPPALAAYATTCAFMWFLYGETDGDDHWAEDCERAVARALELGASLPDTHLAAARMHWQRGRFRQGAEALRRALQLAPTHAAAHAYLGVLQAEGGRPREGIRHVELALELEPTRASPNLCVARYAALEGDYERFERLIQQMWDEPDSRFPAIIARTRHALWMNDESALRRGREQLAQLGKPFPPFHQVATDYVLGEATAEHMLASREANAPPTASPRYRMMLEQAMVEAYLARGQREEGIELLGQLVGRGFIDLHWMERCPLMVVLHGDERIERMLREVRDRTRAIWSATDEIARTGTGIRPVVE